MSDTHLGSCLLMVYPRANSSCPLQSFSPNPLTAPPRFLTLRKIFPELPPSSLPVLPGSYIISLGLNHSKSKSSPVTLRPVACHSVSIPLPNASLLCIYPFLPHLTPKQSAPLKTTCFVFCKSGSTRILHPHRPPKESQLPAQL